MCPDYCQGIGMSMNTLPSMNTFNYYKEEEVVELCVGVGQAYPKGVLWLLAMELVVVF